MTEQEAIKALERLYSDASDKNYPFTEMFSEAVTEAISALEKIQQYQAIGTVRQVQDFIADWRKYKELGSLKECREAVEKQKQEQCPISGDGCGDNGEIIYDTYECPNCGEQYEIDYDGYDYCPKCGQHMLFDVCH